MKILSNILHYITLAYYVYYIYQLRRSRTKYTLF